MTPDTAQVMVRVVAVGVVTWRLFTGPGAITGGSVTGGSVGMGPTVVGSAVVGSVVVGEAIVGSIGVVMAMGGTEKQTNTKVKETLWSLGDKKGTHAVH